MTNSDEMTYWDAGAPLVDDATVTIVDIYGDTVAIETITGSQGDDMLDMATATW